MVDETAAYRWTDGAGQERLEDPLRLKRRLNRLLGHEAARVIADFNGDNHCSAEAAYDKLRAAVCVAFDLGEPVDAAAGRVVPESVWKGRWDDFQGFIAGEKTPPDSRPTSVPSTGPGRSGGPTESRSACG